ncbi:unnamed protein product [Zymoseptoria tritici ST99CH_1A5]|uniref:Uncharacterized protein n=2 Tax=Zymoseptoria tritici TaxID=1047171 RepID=A0A1X7RL36_ZYMT9|nr:unnamed protein product [Zymoseptoria tritici ST99CH_3D7]SMR47943.1 unnamed protein product [Zymoseptoria tritici ST99CH_3D1]SMY21849.1 unnamed protein product [Zymoseptoria tritici ST99CH_1A5]
MSSQPNSPSNGKKKDSTHRRSASENSTSGRAFLVRTDARNQSFGDNAPPAFPTTATDPHTLPPSAETAEDQTADTGPELQTRVDPPAYLINTPTLYGSNTAVRRDELDPVGRRFLGPNGHSPASLRQLAKERRLGRGAAGPSTQAGISAARYVGWRGQIALRDMDSAVSNDGDGPSERQKKDDVGVEERKGGINEDKQKERRSSKEEEEKPIGKGKEREHEPS